MVVSYSAYVHYKALPLGIKVVEGIIEIQAKHDGFCKGCAKGKNTKKKFPSSESQAKWILEIIHSDVCGPMSSSSLSGYVYYASFIDDFSRKGMDILYEEERWSIQQVQGIQSLDWELHRKEDQDLLIR